MRLFGRRPPPEPVPLALPRLGADGWLAGTGTSFAASTYYETGMRQAYEPAAHAVADLLLEAALPLLPTEAAEVDEPYLRKVLLTAARIGAGIGLVERSSGEVPRDLVGPDLASALGLARRGLPAMAEPAARAASWCLLAGHWVARRGPERSAHSMTELVDQLVTDL